MINLTKIIAAVLVLLAITLGAYAWLLSRQPVPVAVPVASAPKPATLFPVVVTARAIPAGQVITADALRVEQLPINPHGALQSASAAAGRVPAFDLGSGTPLLEAQLVSGLALRVAEGERAVAIRADETMGVGNKVRPGDFVDIFFVLKTDNREIDNSQARLLLARKRVLAFGNTSVDGVPSPEQSGKTAQQQRAEPVRTVVLAVAIEDVNRLVLGEASGRLLLALRNPSDLSVPDASLFAELPGALKTLPGRERQLTRSSLQGVDVAHAGLNTLDLASGGDRTGRRFSGGPVASRVSAPGPRSALAGNEVEVIRGDKRETLKY